MNLTKAKKNSMKTHVYMTSNLVVTTVTTRVMMTHLWTPALSNVLNHLLKLNSYQ